MFEVRWFETHCCVGFVRGDQNIPHPNPATCWEGKDGFIDVDGFIVSCEWTEEKSGRYVGYGKKKSNKN